MAEMGGFLNKLRDGKVLRRWARLAQQADKADLVVLREQRARARRLRQHLNKLIFTAENRLALPMIGSTALQKPHNTDWAWRPELWRGPLAVPGKSPVENKSTLGDETTVFHDCAHSELTLRQLRNRRERDLAPYGLHLDVFRFEGSYLSLALDLPADAAQGLQRHHLIRLNTIVEMESPIEIFARLNIKNGPNTEQIVRKLQLREEEGIMEFDLAYTKLNEKRIEKLWLDLIFEGPQMNQIIIRDMTFSRRPRAEF